MIVKKRDLAFTLMFLPFLLDLNLFAPLNDICGPIFIRIIFIDSLLILFLRIRRIKSLSPITKCFVIYGVLIIVFTVMKGNSVFAALYYACSLSAYCVLIDCKFQESPLFVLNFITKLFGCILILTFVCQIIDPTMFGIGSTSGNNYNLWVSDNEMGYVYIPLIVTVASREWILSKKFTWKTYTFILLASISVFMAWGGACVMGTLIMLVGLVVAMFDINWFTFKKLFIIYLMIFFGIIVFRMQDIFSFFIEDILHKDLTFTGRTLAWDMALEQIKENMFIGYGTINGGRLTILNVWANADPVSAHSFFLEVALQGGLIGIALFVMAYWFAGRELIKNKNVKLIILISTSIFAVLIMYITEGWIYHTFQYTLLYLAYYSGDFLDLSDDFAVSELTDTR